MYVCNVLCNAHTISYKMAYSKMRNAVLLYPVSFADENDGHTIK
jgi:hypothetical protein